jgi:hypothetical protein
MPPATGVPPNWRECGREERRPLLKFESIYMTDMLPTILGRRRIAEDYLTRLIAELQAAGVASPRAIAEAPCTVPEPLDSETQSRSQEVLSLQLSNINSIEVLANVSTPWRRRS